LILNKLESSNIHKLVLIQGYIFTLVTIFCIFVKANLFSKESKMVSYANHE